MYVAAGTYYGLSSAADLMRGGSDVRGETTLVVASVWVVLSGLGLAGRQTWGWWGATAFFLVCSGAHLNRIASSSAADAALVAPLVWAAGHLAILSLIRRGSEARLNPMSIATGA